MESADRPALVLDRLEAREGDLLDVGPALENGTVAVTIRSLVWPDTL
jgi:ethanolamine utilization protein EutA (predicted chaperonin)